MTTKNLLVELFVEELPPKALRRLGEAFARGIAASLESQGLIAAGAVATPFATPRRLGVHLQDVAARGADRAVEQKLVPVAIGLDASGAPTEVLLKKLAAVGAGPEFVPALRRASDGKKDTLWLDRTEAGATLADALQRAVEDTLRQLPIPKVMTYQLADGWTDVKFVRPAHGLVALHGEDVIAIGALGLDAGRATRGHRFVHPNGPEGAIAIRSADSYAEQLRTDGAVIASFDERRAAIEQGLTAKADAEGLTAVRDEALLDEVTALVELPNVLCCSFDAEFLTVPQECLILTMKQNQKYFPLLDAAGKLTNRFLLVSNIAPADPSAVIEGNERVVRPRLADAKFFFDQDRKHTLESRLPRLAKVVYHNRLGSQLQRVDRVRRIARAIGELLAARGHGEPDLAAGAERAAELAKADLSTEMVGEFPELQGVMGGYYARNDREPEAIAVAIEDHYKPRFAGDELPRNTIGLCCALADKLETLVGMFGIGSTPTGDKDPFALRRHALGVIRMLVERELPLDLDELVAIAVQAFGAGEDAVEITDPAAALGDFVFERLANAMRDENYSPQEVAAVVALRPQRLAEVRRRLAAVHAFQALPDAAALAAANKRIGNILKKSAPPAEVPVRDELLQEDAERALAAALRGVRENAEPKVAAGDYEAALAACATLRAPVDTFFEAVMVNAEDEALRHNRLALLAALHGLMNRVADLSQLA
ncbi:MAG: glycine--tRNA ligase subunit beta [Planctomycetes bacterium]|nr:glycine--tRNA ligase subunit beta [Planctomycetota bacterium]